MRKLFLYLVIALFLGAAHMQAWAQNNDSGFAPVQSTGEGARAPHRVTAESNGLHFSTASGANTLHVHGYVQADDHMFLSNVHGEPLDTFFFRRIRPLFEGTVFRRVDYRFMPDFGQNNPQIQEAFVDGKIVPGLRLRLGKFKEPIGLEILQQDRQLAFPERSMASDLLPLRYMGAQLGGSVFTHRLDYAAGYFNGSNDGSNGSFAWLPANEFAGRLFVHPLAGSGSEAIRGLGIGIAGSDGHQHGSIAGLKTAGQSTFFQYASTAVANGAHSRISPQANYYGGPVGIESECVVSEQQVRSGAFTASARNVSWQIAGSVLLTGEKNNYDGAIPRHSFAPERGVRHIGAFELTLRASQVRIDRGAFPLLANPAKSAQQGTEFGVGTNWILNRYVKLTTAYEHTKFAMAEENMAAMPAESVIESRVQLAF